MAIICPTKHVKKRMHKYGPKQVRQQRQDETHWMKHIVPGQNVGHFSVVFIAFLWMAMFHIAYHTNEMFSDFLYANSIFNIYWGNGPGQWQSRMIRIDVSAFLRADNIYRAWQSTTQLSSFQISRNILLLHTHTQQSGYKGWRYPVLPSSQWRPRTIAGIPNNGITKRVCEANTVCI